MTNVTIDYIIKHNKTQVFYTFFFQAAKAVRKKNVYRTFPQEEQNMTTPQLYTIVALCVYALAMALIGCISYGKSKTLDGFLIGGRNIGAWVTAFAYGTTYFSAVVFVGYAGQHG